MTILLSPFAPAATANPAAPASSASRPTVADIGGLDLPRFFEQYMETLDTDGDGKVSGREQAAYMARKQASDEYVPSETPTYGDGPGHSARSIAETAYFSELEKTRDSR